MRNRCAWSATLLLIVLLAAPQLLFAQGRSGPTFTVTETPAVVSLLPDASYDPARDRYLVISELGHVAILATLIDSAGNRLAALTIRQSGLAAQNPRVAYSPHVNNGAGGYLVTWHESITPSTAQIWGHLISADATAVGGPFVIGTDTTGLPGTSSNWLMGAAVAYSTVSREFLVSWMGSYGGANDIRFQRVSPAGTVLQATATSITNTTPDWERDPTVAYNPHQDEFYIAYAGWVNLGGYGVVNGQRVRAGTGALIGGAQNLGLFAGPLIPAVAYNTAARQYLVTWYNRSTSSAGFYGITLNGADAAPIGGIRLMSGYYFAYDALDVDYNPAANDFLLVTHGRDEEDAAVSIRADGTPLDNGFVLTDTIGIAGNFNPRAVASTTNGRYLAVTAGAFAKISGQFVQTTGGGGGGCSPNCPPPPPPPPPPPDPRMALDVPGAGAVSGQFAVAGWALDRGAPNGTGVDQVTVWAFNSSNGASTFVGAANLGVSRPDIGAWLGAQFSSSGFGMTGRLPPGTYDINAYARSTVTGLFMAAQARRITVVAPVSEPMMFADFPAQNQTVAQVFTVAGWAVDRASSSGPGVSGIHVWAFPHSGAAAIFVGATTTGHQRPDVAAFFAHPRFGPSGYILQGNLPPGMYNLVVFAWSDIAGGFNQWVLITVRVV